MMRVELDNLREEIKQMRRQMARSGPFGDSAAAAAMPTASSLPAPSRN